MTIDVKNIGEFGVSFSKDLDQTWFFMKKLPYGYAIQRYELIEDDSDEGISSVDTTQKVPFEQGEAILRQVFEDACLEQWKQRYTQDDEGPAVELNWTIDVDDLDGNDIMMISGNWKFPAEGWMEKILQILRTAEPEFGKCFKDLL